MFGRTGQIWYEIVEGKHVNDYDNVGDFLSLSKALRIAKKSSEPYVRIDKFVGDFKGRDGDYVDTVYERMVK
jgi:hypothetical protein